MNVTMQLCRAGASSRVVLAERIVIGSRKAGFVNLVLFAVQQQGYGRLTDSTVPRGSPGIPPRWTSSAKSAVGTAAGAESRVWFTISHGILNEIYAPRLDSACVRDFGLIVTAKNYFSEEKRDTSQAVEMIEDGVPAFRLVNTAIDGRYRITKTVFSDPVRE